MTGQRTYTPQEMADIASYLDKQVARPERVPAGDVAARAGLFGVGAMFVTGAGAWLLQMPWEYALQICGLSFMFTAGASIWWIMPTDKRESAARFRRMMATCEVERTKKLAAYAAIQRLEMQVANQANEIATLRARRNAVQTDDEPQFSQNFTPAANVANENVDKAETIIRYWFDTLERQPDGTFRGKWYSRPIATDAKWTQLEHAAAVKLLDDANMIGRNGKLTYILPQFDRFDVAIEHFNNFCERMRREPELPQPQRIMSNDD